MQHWHVVQTKPNEENLAKYELEKKNFEVFWPTYLHRIQNKRSKKIVSRVLSLFPSYMFVLFDPAENQRWRGIVNLRGVLDLVGATDEFIPHVPCKCMGEIMARVGAEGHIVLEQNPEKITFSRGLRLEVLAETLKGFTGTYCNHSKKFVTIEISLLNQIFKAVLPIDAVRVCASEPPRKVCLSNAKRG